MHINLSNIQIDLIFEEDRGFHAAIVALTQIAKRPIILTSNDPNIRLPSDAQFLVLPFTPPKIEVCGKNCLILSVQGGSHFPIISPGNRQMGKPHGKTWGKNREIK